MGCSNARLLVQAPLTGEPGAATNNNSLSPTTVPTSAGNVATDTNNTSTRMHLTGVDLVVERNGAYTLLLTPKTHKQLMPYVLRKKRFRILVDKPRSDPLLPSNEPILNERIMETNKKTKQNPMESTIESMEHIATNELNKANDRVLGGRSIDRGNPDDEDTYIQSDDEGMVEEIVTTIEEDKDLECKVKKKIETKKTYAQHPETHSKITKVVKTEVTEITHTITINDHHDLERARRELGITDVNRLLPTSSWLDNARITTFKERHYEPTNEIITSKDFPSDSPIKQKLVLAESTSVGRGPVIETIPSSTITSQQKPIEVKKKKKKSKLCSCTRAADDDEHDQSKKVIVPPPKTEETKKVSSPTITPITVPIVKSTSDTSIEGTQLISADMKQLIVDKKDLLIEYIHSKIFGPSNFFSSKEHDIKARKISARILGLLRYDRCSSWKQMSEQLAAEYAGNSTANLYLQSMIKTYENLFTSKQSNLLNTFLTLHKENDIEDIQENRNYINSVQSTTIEAPVTKTPSVEQIEEKPVEEEKQVEKVINEDEQPIKDIKMTDDIQENLPIYNEEQLSKMLADISQHKPITLAEAIAYEYIDLEDSKLGLSNDIIQRIKNLFRPLSDESVSNLIRVKRSGEYLTDINLIETNPFEKLNRTEPYIYQLQQTFEPTLDFNEKQFRLLTETILNNKEQYDQLEFDVAHTSLPIYDMKDSSVNDFSQSDSGYSMTTATHESLASKVKIEFEPINQQEQSIPIKSDEDLDDNERIDLDKASKEQLDKHELNENLIRIIKSDFDGSDKTIGQAILSRELRLDSSDPKDIARLHELGIYKEQIRILTTFFFPKHKRTIAYSPEPGRFVEAQTTYNPDYPGYKTDTTIIQIEEKQLSSDHHAKQRTIHDERTSPVLSQITITESEKVTQAPAPVQESPPIAVVPKEKTPEPTSPPVHVKKRKSSGTGGLLSCFKSKKPKVGTEQQGQPTIQPTTLVSQTTVTQQTTTQPIQTKPLVDYSILPDGRRIYIDAFRERPGLDMSYKPNDFENRFVLPISKPSSEYERPITPELESVANKTEIIHEEEPILTQSEIIEHKPEIHLEPRPATIEPIDIQPEKIPIVVPTKKSEPITVTTKKTTTTIDLHGAAVDLPDIQLVEPGPLPTISTSKVKKSASGLCASCFGAKSNKQKKKESVSKSIPAPIEQKKIGEEKKDLPPAPPPSIITSTATPTVDQSAESSAIVDEPILPKVNIDTFKERTFDKTYESHHKPEERLTTTIEPHYQSASSQSVPPTSITPEKTKLDASIFSTVNIDTFKERTFDKSFESLTKTEQRVTKTVEQVTQPPPLPQEEPHYQLPSNESVTPPKPIEQQFQSVEKDPAIFSKVNIDTFKERTFEKSFESLSKSEERTTTPIEQVTPLPQEEPHYQLPTNEPVTPPKSIEKTFQSVEKDPAIFSKVNIDTFKERTFEKSFESHSKSEQRTTMPMEQVTQLPQEEPHYQSPTNEPITPPKPIEKTFQSVEKDPNIFSKVNIDTFRERTFPMTPEKVQKFEEPHYQLPSNEPISLLQEHNTYDIPRTTELQQTTPSIEIKTEEKIMAPPTSDIHTIKHVEDISSIKQTKTKPIKKKKSKEPKIKKDKKSSVFSTLLCTSKRKSQVPALNLPSIEHDLSPSNQLRKPQPDDTDPFHIPSTNLPKLDLPLPTYDRPEVDMSTGYTKHSSEFSIPVIELPSIPDVALQINDTQQIQLTTDEMKIPNVQLPNLQFTLNKQETVKLPQIEIKTKTEQTKDDVSISPTIETAVVSPSPAEDVTSVETEQKTVSLENETLSVDKIEIVTTQQSVAIIETHLVYTSESTPIVFEKQTKSDLDFELPSPEPVLTVPKESASSPPSFENMAPIISSTKSSEKKPIEKKSEIKQKSSTLALCSCFGNKSTAPKDKSHTIKVPKSSLPQIDMPIPSSNVSSTFKTKGPLRAPSNDLPEVDLTPKSTEQIHLPSIHIPEKKSKSTDETQIIKEQVLIPPPEVKATPTSVSAKETKEPLRAPSTDLPEVDLTPKSTEPIHLPSIHIHDKKAKSTDEGQIIKEQVPTPPPEVKATPTSVSAKETKEPLRAPSIDLPEVDLTPKSTEPIHLPSIHIHDKKAKSTDETQIIKEQVPTPPPEVKATTTSVSTTETKVQSVVSKPPPVEEIKNVSTESKKSSAFEIKAPVMNIPEVDLSGPGKSDAYLAFSKQSPSIPEQIQSRSDSGLEAIVSSHIQPSSTFATIEDIHQHQSISSGLGTLSDTHSIETKYDFTRKITMNDDIRSKLIFRQNELKQCLESEISKSMEDFDTKKDHKSLNKILTHAIDLIKDKKVSTYPELKQKLIMEHKNDAFIVDPVVRSLYFTIEKQGLDNLDKPEFPLAIRDMVRLPAKQTYDTVAHLNKESTSLTTTTEMIKEIPQPDISSSNQVPIEKKAIDTARSCLTCGGRSRSKSKTKISSTISTDGLLDERRREQVNTHRNELTNILRDHIQSSQPPIRKFAEHPKDIEKILRKGLTHLTQPKTHSYEQIRNDLKCEYKQKYYLIDPIVDIIRDTNDHCDITQMNEKINLDILDSNISQTAYLYNNQMNLLTTEESNAFKSNQLSWLQQYLITNESKEKKLTRKQTKELNKILNRTLEILSSNNISTWDELTLQLQREFPKAHDLCNRSVELMKQSQRDGLFLLQQAPIQDKRRASSLITERARQNLKSNRNKIILSLKNFFKNHSKLTYDDKHMDTYLNKIFHYLEHQKQGQFKSYQDLKEQLKKDFHKNNDEQLLEQIVDIIEQAHATNQFDDIDKPEVQTLLKDRLEGKPLVIKEVYVSLPPRIGGSKYSTNDQGHYSLTTINGDRLNSTTSSHPIARGLSWREANERARILFYRGKHPAIHYDEQAAAFDVRMLLETASGGTQEIPVTDSDIHELLNSCGVQWDGVNIISLVDHSEEVVRAAEQAALKVIREKGLVEVRTPPHDDDINGTINSSS